MEKLYTKSDVALFSYFKSFCQIVTLEIFKCSAVFDYIHLTYNTKIIDIYITNRIHYSAWTSMYIVETQGNTL